MAVIRALTLRCDTCGCLSPNHVEIKDVRMTPGSAPLRVAAKAGGWQRTRVSSGGRIDTCPACAASPFHAWAARRLAEHPATAPLAAAVLELRHRPLLKVVAVLKAAAFDLQRAGLPIAHRLVIDTIDHLEKIK